MTNSQWWHYAAFFFLFLMKSCKKSYSFSQNHEAESQKRWQGFLFGFVLGVGLVDLKSAQTSLKKAEFVT